MYKKKTDLDKKIIIRSTFVKLVKSNTPFSSSSVDLFSLFPSDNGALLEPFVPVKS